MQPELKNTPHKTGWFDGWFFAKFIDPLSGKPFNEIIKGMIGPGKTVLDVGCGTGSLSLGIANTCARVVGVDISPKMIAYARKMQSRAVAPNVEFILADKTKRLRDTVGGRFDFAVLKMMLHETWPAVRDAIMEEAKLLADEFIVADWVSPQPAGFAGIKTRVIEFTAGREHHANFKNWCAAGGIDGFIKKHGLAPVGERMFRDRSGKIVHVRKNGT
jgi:SAM-dependent methyltransferase